MRKDEAINRIFQTVEDVTRVSQILIVSKSRDRDVHFARMIVAHHLRIYGFRYGSISGIIGRHSESNVTYLLRAYDNEQTPYFRSCAEKVEQILKKDEKV